MKRFHLELAIIITLALVAVGALSIAQQPAGEIKLAYVDFQKILDESVEGKKAQDALEKKFGETKEMLKKKGTELKQLQEEIEKQCPVLTPIVCNEKKNLFKAKYTSYMQQKMLLQEQYNNEFIKLVSPMQKEIDDVIQKLGKEKGYSMIFKYDLSSRTQEAVLAEYLFFPSSIAYMNPGLDITVEVLKRYDTAHK